MKKIISLLILFVLLFGCVQQPALEDEVPEPEATPEPQQPVQPTVPTPTPPAYERPTTPTTPQEPIEPTESEPTVPTTPTIETKKLPTKIVDLDPERAGEDCYNICKDIGRTDTFCQSYCNLLLKGAGVEEIRQCPSGMEICTGSTVCDITKKYGEFCCEIGGCIEKKVDYDPECYTNCILDKKNTVTFCQSSCKKTLDGKESYCPALYPKCGPGEICLGRHSVSDKGCCFTTCVPVEEGEINQECYGKCMDDAGATISACKALCSVGLRLDMSGYCPSTMPRCEEGFKCPVNTTSSGCCYTQCVPEVMDESLESCINSCTSSGNTVTFCTDNCQRLARQQFQRMCPSDTFVCPPGSVCKDNRFVGEACCYSECVPPTMDYTQECMDECLANKTNPVTYCQVKCEDQARAEGIQVTAYCPVGTTICPVGTYCLANAIGIQGCCTTECIPEEISESQECYYLCMNEPGATVSACKAQCNMK